DTEATKTGVGISLALSIVNDSSSATTARDLFTTGGAAAFLASTVSISESTAKASVKGGENGGDKADQKKGKQMDFADSTAKSKAPGAKGTNGATAPTADTGRGQVDVAGAIAVNIENASSVASIPDSRHVTATGLITVQSAINADGHALADGSAATASGGTGVGVAVAVNVNNITNHAFVGNGAVVSGSGLNVDAIVADRNIAAPVVTVPVVDAAEDTLFVGLDAGLASGDQVKYVGLGGFGLTPLSSYFVHVN